VHVGRGGRTALGGTYRIRAVVLCGVRVAAVTGIHVVTLPEAVVVLRGVHVIVAGVAVVMLPWVRVGGSTGVHIVVVVFSVATHHQDPFGACWEVGF